MFPRRAADNGRPFCFGRSDWMCSSPRGEGLSGALLFAGGARSGTLLLRRTNRNEIAAPASESAVRRERAGANVGCGLLNLVQQALQLFLVAGCADDVVRLEIVQGQTGGTPVKDLTRGKSVGAQLHVLASLLGIARLARLVIDDFFSPVGQAIDLVNPPGENHVVFERQIE